MFYIFRLLIALNQHKAMFVFGLKQQFIDTIIWLNFSH